MRNKWIILLLLVACTAAPPASHEQTSIPKTEASSIPQPIDEVENMKLTSTAFAQEGKIPSIYTCDGDNFNPALKISDAPKNAKSLVLIMDDPDIPDFVKQKLGKDVFDHWVLFNIKPDVTEIKEKEAPGIQGANGAGTAKYTGPCPPDREHRYFFKLYALDTMLSLKSGATKEQVLEAIKGHVLAEAELMGKYQRK
jgi:hypothetical protein